MKPVDSRTMLVHFPANLKVGCPETVSAGINIVRDPDGARSRDPNRKVFFAGKKRKTEADLQLIPSSWSSPAFGWLPPSRPLLFTS